MWVIVLDRSGSMADPFTGESALSDRGRVRQTDAQTKWAAATQAVRDEVASLNEDERVCLIAFEEAPVVAFDGTAAQRDQLDAALGSLEPAGGTNLAAALQAAAEVTRPAGDPHISVVVVSDGLAEEDESRAAAKALALRAAMI